MQQCHSPRLVAVTKFKTTKINFEGFFGLHIFNKTTVEGRVEGSCITDNLNIVHDAYVNVITCPDWYPSCIQVALAVLLDHTPLSGQTLTHRKLV